MKIDGYNNLLGGVSELLDVARHIAARSVNAILTVTYWEIGRRIVEFEQGGNDRAAYGEALLQRLSHDLVARFGRGFGLSNLKQMRNHQGQRCREIRLLDPCGGAALEGA